MTLAAQYCWAPKTTTGYLLWLDLTAGRYAQTPKIEEAVRSTEEGKTKFERGMGVYLRGWEKIEVEDAEPV